MDRAEVTRRGDGLQEWGAISPAAQTRTVAAIQGMVEEARQAGTGEVVAVGAMGMRNARNADAFVAAVRAACGVTIEVISGDEEARLAYLAVQDALGIPGGVTVVFDIGGGSTQVTIGQNGEIRKRFSINLGATRLTEQFGLSGPVSAEALAASRAAIVGELGPPGRRRAAGRPRWHGRCRHQPGGGKLGHDRLQPGPYSRRPSD